MPAEIVGKRRLKSRIRHKALIYVMRYYQVVPEEACLSQVRYKVNTVFVTP